MASGLVTTRFTRAATEPPLSIFNSYRDIPNGDVYVSLNQPDGVSQIARMRPDRAASGVVVLRDADHDGRAEKEAFVPIPDLATGIVVRGRWLYVARRTTIERRAIDPAMFGALGSPETVVRGLPEGGHNSKNIVFDDAGGMFVSAGSNSNVCRVGQREAAPDPCPELETRAGIWRFDADRLDQSHPGDGVRWATGVRNAMGLYWHSGLRALFATSHGRDSLSRLFPALFTNAKNADTPSEEFFRVERGTDVGWPYCYHDRELPGHWAPNDMLIYAGTQFPDVSRRCLYRVSRVLEPPAASRGRLQRRVSANA